MEGGHGLPDKLQVEGCALSVAPETATLATVVHSMFCCTLANLYLLAAYAVLKNKSTISHVV